MPRRLDGRLIDEIAEAVVQLGHQFSPQLVAVMKADARLVRANLIAYYAFNVTVYMRRHVDKEAANEFIPPFLASVVVQGALDPFGGTDFILSRCQGNSAAVKAYMGGSDVALSNYFQGCCSVNRAEIGYDEVFPDPEGMEFALRNLGGTPAGYAELRKIRSLSSPAIYPFDGIKSFEVHALLLSGAEGMKTLVQGAMEG